MTTQKHTPTATPWRIGGRDGRAWTITNELSRHAAFPVIFGKNGARICNVDSMEGEPCDANAAFIVLAVNSHEALVEALKDIQRDVDVSSPSYKRAWRIAEDAIALVEGRTA